MKLNARLTCGKEKQRKTGEKAKGKEGINGEGSEVRAQLFAEKYGAG
jgi:hypothetical protein